VVLVVLLVVMVVVVVVVVVGHFICMLENSNKVNNRYELQENTD
jgi:flagellar basal body-associated protein FliL